MEPLRLEANQFPRFYRGGARIDALRGAPPGEDHRPEDWVGSAATTFGQEREGLSRLPDGRTLRDAIAADPEAFLGAEHVRRHGADPALLVKLLDAGERLPVHYHPGRRFAREHLGLGFGKTEAWIVLEAEPEAAMRVGLRERLEPDAPLRWVEEQDVAEMLAALHEVRVRAGDVIFVPAGTLHAIGEGVLILELQEPTDLSVLVEWRGLGLPEGAEHLRLGWPAALEALDREPADPHALVGRPSRERAARSSLLPAAADPYFRAERIWPAGEPVGLEPAFAILVVLRGEGRLAHEGGEPLALVRGDTLLVPYGCGETRVEGDVLLVRCLPPRGDAGPGPW